MAPRPTAERPPKGLNSHWMHTWDQALDLMKADGTWGWELKPLLDEYVYALRAAEATREGLAWLDHLGSIADCSEIDFKLLSEIAKGLPTQWDRHTKRAAMLAEKLVLTPEARRRHGIHVDDEDGSGDPFAALDAAADELGPRRQARAA